MSRVASSCSSHTIPDMPVTMRVANAEYLGSKGKLYVCGGHVEEEGRTSGDVYFGPSSLAASTIDGVFGSIFEFLFGKRKVLRIA